MACAESVKLRGSLLGTLPLDLAIPVISRHTPAENRPRQMVHQITKERLRTDFGILAAFLAGLPVRFFLCGLKPEHLERKMHKRYWEKPQRSEYLRGNGKLRNALVREIAIQACGEVSKETLDFADNQLIWTESALVRFGLDVGPAHSGSPQNKKRH
jgi:hypothetical protein